MSVKNIIRSYISTVMGLLLLFFLSIQLWDVSKGLQEFDLKFAAGLLLIGLALLFADDNWLRRMLKKLVGKLAEKL